MPGGEGRGGERFIINRTGECVRLETGMLEEGGAGGVLGDKCREEVE